MWGGVGEGRRQVYLCTNIIPRRELRCGAVFAFLFLRGHTLFEVLVMCACIPFLYIYRMCAHILLCVRRLQVCFDEN